MKIILGGVLSRHPCVPGSVWHRLHYLLGLLGLGHDVYFVEEVGPDWCVDGQGRRCPYEHSVNRELFRETIERFGLSDRACQVYNRGEATLGLSPPALEALARGADLLINMSGNVKSELVLGNVRRRAYEDSDPVYTQLWHAEYGKDLNFGAHQVFFTRGLNIGTPHSPIPDCGLRWHPVLPPVVLDRWPARPDGPGRRFTTVASWGGYGDLCFRGEWYRSKYAEFRRFAGLPRAVGRELEVVLRNYRAGDEGVRLLRENGWVLAEAGRAADLDGYQDYIARSRGEIGIAKDAYVRGHSGWFSERAAHYLASGRPVLHQATGFERHLPTGRGLVAFATPEEAAAGVEAIDRDYERHCRAARELAEAYLDHRKVLPRMLEIGAAAKGAALPQWRPGPCPR
jgi:hypothetical protein